MRVFFLTIALAIGHIAVTRAQQRAIDSLENLLRTSSYDTSTVKVMNELIGKLQYTNPEKADSTAHESIALATRLNYRLGLAIAFRLRGVMFADKTMLDSARSYYRKAQNVLGSDKRRLFRRQQGLLTHNFGVIYHRNQQYDSATQNYLEATRIFKSVNEEKLCFFPFNNLATMYSFLKDNNKALEYAKETYTAAIAMKDPGKVAMAVNQEMSIRIELKQYDKVKSPLLKNLEVLTEYKNYYSMGMACNLLGNYYTDGVKKYDSAIFYRKEALVVMEKLGNQYEVASILQNIGYDYKLKKDLRNAEIYLKRSISLARSLELYDVLGYGLGNLAETEEALGNSKAAYTYLTEMVIVNDSLRVRNDRDKVNELEAKYQNEKKVFQIKQLEADKKFQMLTIKQSNILNYILFGSAITLIVIIILAYRTYKQKQELQQQRIIELEFEKKLMTTEAILKGEEQERTRLAKDLHDGLGGMLSGLKYSFTTMKENLIMTPENQLAFERSMDMLDSSIKEMRRVAHNMMPEALIRFGLNTTLNDFCNNITQSGALNVRYQSIGITGEFLDQTTSITLYRVIQELMNNIMKHANATSVVVQVTKTDGHITVTVEDNGKGFDTSLLNANNGIGWVNIRNRIDFLMGKVDVISRDGEGTSVLIELPG